MPWTMIFCGFFHFKNCEVMFVREFISCFTQHALLGSFMINGHRRICPATYRLTIFCIHNILSVFLVLQQTLKHFRLHFVQVNWTRNIWLSYLGVDFDDATLTASVNQTTIHQASTELSILWIAHALFFHMKLNLFFSIVFLCDSSETLFASNKILFNMCVLVVFISSKPPMDFFRE